MTRIVFLLGTTEQHEEQQKVRVQKKENIIQYYSKVKEERDKYNDIVQGNFHDSYRNLTYKNMFGLLWVSNFCEQAEFVIKTDDDMYVDLYEVFTITRNYRKHQVDISSNFILFKHQISTGLPEQPVSAVPSIQRLRNSERSQQQVVCQPGRDTKRSEEVSREHY